LLAGIELRRKCNAEVLLAASLFDLGRYYQFVEDDEAARCAVDEATQIKEKYSLAWLPVPYPAPILSKS
jgi:hypothetical protein